MRCFIYKAIPLYAKNEPCVSHLMIYKYFSLIKPDERLRLSCKIVCVQMCLYRIMRISYETCKTTWPLSYFVPQSSKWYLALYKPSTGM